MGGRITAEVKRRPKKNQRMLKNIMIVLGIFFVLIGVLLNRGFMLPGFCMVALYYFFTYRSKVDYEYVLEDGKFRVDIIRGAQSRENIHMIDVSEIEVIAPHADPAVAKYRKNGGSEQIPKYDYTSYDDNIPYYTMIAYEGKQKIKLLLDLNDELLREFSCEIPQKTIR